MLEECASSPHFDREYFGESAFARAIAFDHSRPKCEGPSGKKQKGEDGTAKTDVGVRWTSLIKNANKRIPEAEDV